MSKGAHNLIAGLDIGSSAIRMAVGQMTEREGGGGELQILSLAEYPSEGVHRGIISSIEDVVSSISGCLERAERMVGIPIDNVWVGISGLHILSQNSKGVVAVSKADNEIAEEDVARAIEAARSIATPLNYEVLHVLPKNFNVDGQTGIKDPVGMTGIRLEVDAQIILGSSSQIKNITKAVYRTGLEICDMVLSILAVSEAAATSRQKDLGVAVVNIGASTTSLAVFEEGDILHSAILPLGSEHITNDIAIGLRTSVDIAERVKIEYGNCAFDDLRKREEIDLFDMGAEAHELVKKKYLSEIVIARVEEIMAKVDAELSKARRSGLLPAGALFTGGGSKLVGLAECAKKALRLPATLGYPLNITSVTDKVNDLGFATAIGLLKWGSVMEGKGGHRRSFLAGLQGVKKVSGLLRNWIKILIP